MKHWMKILKELEPIHQSQRMHEKLYKMLRKAEDYTPETADEFKEEQELLNNIVLAQLSYTKEKGEWDDMFGDYLRETEQLNARAGQFFTPMNIARFMAKLIGTFDDEEPPEGEEMFSDPACGTGRFMIKRAETHHKQYGHHNYLMCVNTDIDFRMYVYCTMNAIIRRIPSINVWGDSLAYNFREAFLVTPKHIPTPWLYMTEEQITEWMGKPEPRGQQTIADAPLRPRRIIMKPTNNFEQTRLFGGSNPPAET